MVKGSSILNRLHVRVPGGWLAPLAAYIQFALGLLRVILGRYTQVLDYPT